ncbi:DgyrCDS14545 [Dimorphilus gyrociliatus]|uniref:DgyrCDS14545 n=1 Tax=Dimorphilus gyrociliatus TaxID=2664684 RepID=A0A7I8WE01_9ANNE|nr:DgyrCDS14545 [Dimorphilus gyrociliatus]
MSSTVELGLYEYISNIYNSDSNENTSIYDANLPGNLIYDTEFVFNYTAHRQSNFIFDCQWANKPCKSEYISRTITEYGVCYTFNSPSALNETKGISIGESGMANALSFLFNIEQYEHMPGPFNNAGVKIVLHDDYKKPLIADLGFAIAPGMHTLVGIKRIESYKLSNPYGECVKSEYKSHAECIDYCRLSWVADMCHCIPFEAILILGRAIKNDKRYCNLSETYGCVRASLEKVQNDKNIHCSCSVPCSQIIYEPNLSFSSISEFAANKLLNGNSTGMNDLKQKFSKILEIKERRVKSNFEKNTAIISPFTTKIYFVLQRLDGPFRQFLTDQEDIALFRAIFFDLYKIMINFGTMAESFDSYPMRHIRQQLRIKSNKIYQYRTGLFGPVSIEKEEMLTNLENCIKDLHKMNESLFIMDCSRFMKHFKFSKYKIHLKDFRLFWSVALKDFQDQLSSIIQAETLEKMHIEEIERIFGLNISNPKIPFNTICHPFYDSLAFMENSMTFPTVFQNDSYANIGTKINIAVKALLSMEESLYQINYFDDSYCLLNKRIFIEIDNRIRELLILSEDISFELGEFHKSIRPFYDIHHLVLTKTQQFQSYLHFNSTIKKANLSNSFSLSCLLDNINSLMNFYENIQSQKSTFQNAIEKVSRKLSVIENYIDFIFMWPIAVKHPDNTDIQYTDVNQVYSIINKKKNENNLNLNCPKERLQNFSGYTWSTCLKQFTYGMISHNFDFPNISQQSFIDVLNKFNDLQLFLNEFDKISKVDKDFFRRNFAKVDVFYKEMSFQKIIQQEKFAFLSFISEIGGFLGLVLGASVITIIEFIDFFALKLTSKIFRRI